MKVHLNQEPRCALVWNFGPDRPGFGILELAARQYKLRLRAVGKPSSARRSAALWPGGPANRCPKPFPCPTARP